MRNTSVAHTSKGHARQNGSRTSGSKASGLVGTEHAQQAQVERASRTIAQLRDEIAQRDEFIASAAHELRNAMAGVLINAGNMLYLARKSTDTPPWVGVRLESLERQARHFVRRATTLLDASRLATGGCTLDQEQLDLGEVVGEVLADLSSEAERAGCALRVTAEKAVSGCWDRSAVETIAMNLLSNAIKYGAGTPVTVVVASDRVDALLSVRDGGIGIAPEDLGRIFERFERAGRRRDQPGFGIGLWIARQLAVAHGGDIAVESTLGRGSVFTARLPRAIHEPQQ